MAAILRVKRKKDEEPSDALLIACKRPKVESDEASSTPLTAIVKFAGTVEKQEDCVVQHITKILTKDALKVNFKQHIVDITKKAREERKQVSNENRYKIINNIRSLDTSLIEDLEEDVINIIDIEDTKHIHNKENNHGYVYDLYYTEIKEDLEIANLQSVLPIETAELVFEDCEDDNDARYNDTSEDSNSESNWRNDYPDSDSANSDVGETCIKNAMKNLNIDDELSSDSDDFIYGYDNDDVERYGFKYAKYKQRMKKEKEEFENSYIVNSDDSEDEEVTSDDIEEFDGQ